MHPIGETADGVPYANGSGWEVNFGGNVRLVSFLFTLYCPHSSTDEFNPPVSLASTTRCLISSPEPLCNLRTLFLNQVDLSLSFLPIPLTH